MDYKLQTLQKIFQLTEYVKIQVDKDKANNHHPLKHDLTNSSKRILLMLQNKGPLNQRTISKELNLSPQAISQTVIKLEEKGLITKSISKTETIITLTNEGKTNVEFVKTKITNHANYLFKDFDDKELINIINFVNKLTEEEKKND